jgi:HSP20 family protein
MKTILNRNHLPVFFDDFLGDVFNTGKIQNPTEKTTTAAPAVNIKESDIDYQIELAAPGMEKSDFKISIDQNLLSIFTEKREDKIENTEKFSRKEFGYMFFKRNFTLPEGKIEKDQIKAKYEAGILKLTLPKKLVEESKTIKNIFIE